MYYTSKQLLTEGLELVIAPSRAQPNPEQLRQFARLVLQAHAQVMQTTAPQKSANTTAAPSLHRPHTKAPMNA